MSTSSPGSSPLLSLSATTEPRLQAPYSGISARDFHFPLAHALTQWRSQRPHPGPTNAISQPSTVIQTGPECPEPGSYLRSSPPLSVRAVLQHRPQAPYQNPPPAISQPSITSMRQTEPQRHQAGSYNHSVQGSLGRIPGMSLTRSQQPTSTLSGVDVGRPQNSDEAPSSEGSGRSLTTISSYLIPMIFRR